MGQLSYFYSQGFFHLFSKSPCPMAVSYSQNCPSKKGCSCKFKGCEEESEIHKELVVFYYKLHTIKPENSATESRSAKKRIPEIQKSKGQKQRKKKAMNILFWCVLSQTLHFGCLVLLAQWSIFPLFFFFFYFLGFL